MRKIDYKVDLLRTIWSDTIFEHKYFHSKFNDWGNYLKTNYIGDIFFYFDRTLDIVFGNSKVKEHSEILSYHICLLQIIYVQQDLIEEILRIFKTGINKGALQKDENYIINRDLRNELVGHPLRKQNGILVSSAIFSFRSVANTIEVGLYHSDNDFHLDIKRHAVADIKRRHKKFLEKYLDIAINKSKELLKDYLSKLQILENLISKGKFENILNLTEYYFETLLKHDYCYDKDSLLEIYGKRTEHNRYSNYIEVFFTDLKENLSASKRSIEEILANVKNVEEKIPTGKQPKIKIEEFDLGNGIIEIVICDGEGGEKIANEEKKEDYHYELGKLSYIR